MPVRKYAEVEANKVEMEDVVDVVKKVPIGKDEGWDNYTLRTFTIGPGGHTPKHTHDWEHVNYIIRGQGKLMIDGREHIVESRDFALVPANAEHQYSNPFDEDFEFICIVPNRGEY
jgi:quercetin dioxygenase-like cupin family protein